MAAQLQLAEQQLADLKTVCKLGPTVLSRLSTVLENLTPPPVRPESLIREIKSALGEHSADAECLSRQAISFNGLMRQTGLVISDVLDGIRAAIKRDTLNDLARLQEWNAVEPHFKRIVMSAGARLTANAIDLSYDYANLYRRARILTDIRPLFNETGDAIEGAVVSFTLRLRYDSVDGDHDISIVMDERDVKQLVEQCQRSLIKSATAQKTMRMATVPTFITGARNNDAPND
jgi:hypothetical protein